MDMLATALPVVIYFLLIVLLIIVIVIGIKLIGTLNKVDKIVNDINNKMESLNGLFSIIDYTTDKIASISDTVVGFVSNGFGKIFKKFKKESEINE